MKTIGGTSYNLNIMVLEFACSKLSDPSVLALNFTTSPLALETKTVLLPMTYFETEISHCATKK